MFIKKFFTVFITDLYIFSVCSHSQDSRIIEIPRSSNYFLHFFRNPLSLFETIFTGKQKKQNFNLTFRRMQNIPNINQTVAFISTKEKKYISRVVSHESKSNLIILSFQEKKRKISPSDTRATEHRHSHFVGRFKVGRSLETLTASLAVDIFPNY